MNASHSWAVNTSTGLALSLESRTATLSWTNATSTQPLTPLRVLLRHTARDRSTLISFYEVYNWLAKVARVLVDSAGFSAAARRCSKIATYRLVTSASSTYWSPPVFSM
jgi:hypothetical protein